MAKKKGPLEKWFDGLERKAKRAVARKVRSTAQAAGRGISRGVKAGARAAVERARVKPQKMVSDMRAAGWSPQQIHQRTGVPVRTQNDILKGRSNGQKHLEKLREARKLGGRTTPPEQITPVKAARQPGEGVVRKTKSGTTIVAGPDTDKAWLAQAQREAAKKGQVKVILKDPPKPRPAIDPAGFRIQVHDRADGRVRTLTADQLQLTPGTLDRVAAALYRGNQAEADKAFLAGINVQWYRDWLTPGSTLARTGTLDGFGGGPEGAARRASMGDAAVYDDDDGDSVIYDDAVYDGSNDDSDYGGIIAAITSRK